MSKIKRKLFYKNIINEWKWKVWIGKTENDNIRLMWINQGVNYVHVCIPILFWLISACKWRFVKNTWEYKDCSIIIVIIVVFPSPTHFWPSLPPQIKTRTRVWLSFFERTFLSYMVKNSPSLLDFLTKLACWIFRIRSLSFFFFTLTYQINTKLSSVFQSS